jgi:hypothetical protein
VTGKATWAGQALRARRLAVIAVTGAVLTASVIGVTVTSIEREGCQKQVERWYALSAGAAAVRPGMFASSVRILMGAPDRVVRSESRAAPPGSVEWHYDTPDPSCGGANCFIRVRVTPAGAVFGQPRDGCIQMSAK